MSIDTNRTIVNGEYNTATIMTDIIEEAALEQVRELTNLRELKDAKIVMQPDLHAGKGCTIGTTIRYESFENMKINPEWVGNDIGCSVSVFHLGNVEDVDMDFDKLDELSKTLDKPSPISNWIASDTFEILASKNVAKRATKEIGRISGGNHMAEVGIMNGEYYVTVHNGSLFLGQHVYKKWMRKLEESSRLDTKPIIKELKSQGKLEYIEPVLKSIKEKQKEVNSTQKYLFGDDLKEYIRDVGLCTYYAYANHEEVFVRFRDALGVKNRNLVPAYRSTHNFIDGFTPFLDVKTDKPLTVYKGATPARKGQDVIIPINMRDGIIVGKGKGNPDYNCAAPHGAGRLMSRTKAKKNIELDTYLTQLKGVRSISVNENTLDEAPDAYKSIDYILERIEDTVEVTGVIKPIYNFKVAEEEPYWMMKKRRSN